MRLFQILDIKTYLENSLKINHQQFVRQVGGVTLIIRDLSATIGFTQGEKVLFGSVIFDVESLRNLELVLGFSSDSDVPRPSFSRY